MQRSCLRRAGNAVQNYKNHEKQGPSTGWICPIALPPHPAPSAPPVSPPSDISRYLVRCQRCPAAPRRAGRAGGALGASGIPFPGGSRRAGTDTGTVPLPAGFKGAGRELHPSPKVFLAAPAMLGEATAGRGCDQAGSWERWPGSQPSVRKQQSCFPRGLLSCAAPRAVPRRDNGARSAPRGCCSSREHNGRQVAASPPWLCCPHPGSTAVLCSPHRPQLLPRR